MRGKERKVKSEPILLLPDEVRPCLKRPLGQLFPGIRTAADHLRKLRPARLITVGDIVTVGFLAAGVKPDIAVVDFTVMRAPATEKIKRLVDSFDARIVRVKNPAGTITPELRGALKTAKPPVKLIIEGEEDLATIPAVLSAPRGSAVVYGQPNEGVVLIEVTEAKRREFQELLKKFKPSQRS